LASPFSSQRVDDTPVIVGLSTSEYRKGYIMMAPMREQYDETLRQVVAALQDRSLAKVARLAGLHENTVRAIASGKNKKPALETLEKLADHLLGSA
jgi:DNA-binding Xre family transcriptional regulator